MLTKRQYDLLLFINDYMRKNSIVPSFEEMQNHLKLKSKSGVHRLVFSLQERGFIRKLPYRARAIEILRLPANQTEASVQPVAYTGATPFKGTGQTSRRADGRQNWAQNWAKVGLRGRIAAGVPIEAIAENQSEVDVPQSMLGKGQHYALEVEGDSMKDAGIQDGDTIIIEHRRTAEVGDIVVALIDNEEATLKTLGYQGQNIVLSSANSDYPPRHYRPEQVAIQGRLVGLLRKY